MAAKRKQSTGKKEVKPEVTKRLRMKLSPWQLQVLVGLIVVVALAWFLKGYLVAAIVNGTPIYRFTVVSELEKQSGQRALDSIVTKTLILQEGAKRNIQVSPEEIDGEIDRIKKEVENQGQNLDDLLASQGLTSQTLREQIEIQKKIEKMFESDVSISQEEIDTYLEENKEFLPQDLGQEEQVDSVRQQLRAQKLQEKFTAWLDEAKAAAKITYYVKY